MKRKLNSEWENKGFILLHRKALNNPALHSNPARWSVWTHLLMFATHSEMQKEFMGHTIVLKPGQLITGRKFLSKETGISQTSVERILKWLESEHQIGQQKSSQNRLISILNWDKYQIGGQESGQQTDNKRTTDGQRADTYNNVNNVKNVESLKQKPLSAFNKKQEHLDEEQSIKIPASPPAVSSDSSAAAAKAPVAPSKTPQETPKAVKQVIPVPHCPDDVGYNPEALAKYYYDVVYFLTEGLIRIVPAENDFYFATVCLDTIPDEFKDYKECIQRWICWYVHKLQRSKQLNKYTLYISKFSQSLEDFIAYDPHLLDKILWEINKKELDKLPAPVGVRTWQEKIKNEHAPVELKHQ